MVVYILERAPAGLRGELTRWMIEPKAGVFVGQITAAVRQKLWEKICQKIKEGACIMIWNTNTEQGYRIEFWGTGSRVVYDWEGLQLVTKPQVQ
ncbi:type I-E CRISPR-associated endoribonuclease Cas2 [Candidatus Sumerlaeota bacterium]|nr:type I-E CRISPR-associated endoribonuclease Cas2 [Candidatus Sumerlaeota bacterium]